MAGVTRTKVVLAFTAIYLIWGSTYLAIRFGVETMPPFLMAGVRFICGGAVFYFIAKGQGAASPKAIHWLTTAVIGVLMVLGGNGLVTYAETTVPSGLTALLVAMVPMWIVLTDWLRPGGHWPGWITFTSLLIGFGGVALLINPTDIGGLSEIHVMGALTVVMATIFWALGSIYSRHARQPESKWLSAGMQMIGGGVALVVVGLMTGETSGLELSAISTKSIVALGYLTLFGSLGFAAYIWLLKATQPAKAATYAYVNPIIALVLGNILAGEAISWWTAGCASLIILSVLVIITQKVRKVQPSKEETGENDPVPVMGPVDQLKRCES